jgi:serine/threonine-protein kinase RsbW
MRHLRQEFRVAIEELESIRAWIFAFLGPKSTTAQETFHEISVAVTEIFANLVKHSNLTENDLVEVQLQWVDHRLTVHFVESSEPFNIDAVDDPDLSILNESGCGLFLAKNLMDSFEYSPKTAKRQYNVTTMTKGFVP